MTTQPHAAGRVDLRNDSQRPARPLAPSQAASSGCDELPTITDGSALRDVLVDLVNADGRFGWSAVAVAMPLSCDRHAVDVTDEHSNVWRIDVHDLPRRLEVA